jgi:hypothetical protein
MPGEMKVDVALREIVGGCELRVAQAGIPDVITFKMCVVGGKASLVQLAALVEADAPA